ncbi:MAG: MvdC/MvdD family ATP grasp protein, partial [Bacteroidota bacterium]
MGHARKRTRPAHRPRHCRGATPKNTMKEKILIITHSEDHECIPRVTEALEAQGAEVLRFDTDRYPT